jgi:mannan endo-1,4-beta-mannosidase
VRYGPRYNASWEAAFAPIPQSTEPSIRNGRSRTWEARPPTNLAVPRNTARLRAAPVNGTEQTSPVPPASPAPTSPQPGLTANPLSPGSPQEKLSVTGRQVRRTAQRDSHRKAKWISIVVCAVLLIGAAIPITLKMRSAPGASSTQPIQYLGVYERDASSSYSGVSAFTTATGVRPDIVTYFSSWLEAFQTNFATNAAEHGALPLVQINPYKVSLAAIAAGQYDSYLRAYAEAVRTYSHPVILSFGHEMNGTWYPWGYTHTSPSTFVNAWRHIVNVFRSVGAKNVIWLWTANIIQTGGIPSPQAWWPGSSYVNWVGLDGYYYHSSWTFTSLFGPTFAAVRQWTQDPILIAETGAQTGPSQPAKIADLFAGVRLYRMLGFVWFDAKAGQDDWRLTTPAAFAAFRKNASAYYRPKP